ncbi:MAG: hypothetical protein RSD67_02475 [Oscillospiraceae bacterium]
MKKERLIKDIHKVLYIYEDGVYSNYFANLSHLIIELSGLNNKQLATQIILLKGLKNLGAECTHFDVRNTILGIMNDINRDYKED